MTLLMLLDRRLYHICNSRDNTLYIIISKTIGIIVFFMFISFVVLSILTSRGNSIPTMFFDILFYGTCSISGIALIIGLLPGKLLQEK